MQILPEPVISNYEGFFVLRDDLLEAGSKIRFVGKLLEQYQREGVTELVYGSCPATGWAQISLPLAAKRYDMKVVLFMAKRDMSNLTKEQQKAIEYGADIRWIDNGMLTVTESRARKYVANNPVNRRLFPIGLDHPMIIDSIAELCKSLPIKPTAVWSVASSGTLSRGLQAGFPDAEVHAVAVGHKMKPEQIGRAIVHPCKYKFTDLVKDSEKPPYPSVSTYDAKVWKPCLDYYEQHPELKKIVLIWNVAGDLL